MKRQVKSQKFQKKRKFFLILPALTLPFITLIFWAFGGGKGEDSSSHELLETGLILDLPDAALRDDQTMTKLDFYNQAQADSAKLRELMKNDPNYRPTALGDPMQSGLDELNTSLNSQSRYNDANEEKIYQKLAELDRELNKPYESAAPAPYLSRKPNSSLPSADIDRLEQMMQSMVDPGVEDEEMRQINSVLEAILDIQHPERVQQRLSENTTHQKGRVYPVLASSGDVPISLISSQSEDSPMSNGFYSFTETFSSDGIPNAIEAVIHQTQTLVNGSTVKLRLLDDVVINRVTIPKDNFLFGTAQLNGERLEIRINSVRYNNSLFPVELSVYDMDGQDGVYIPGAITRDAAKESADRSIQTIGLTSLDPSWGAQAATAGIQAAKTLLSRKVKLVKVTVKAGYQVLLRDEKQKQD